VGYGWGRRAETLRGEKTGNQTRLGRTGTVEIFKVIFAGKRPRRKSQIEEGGVTPTVKKSEPALQNRTPEAVRSGFQWI